jgi:hypothetical protein
MLACLSKITLSNWPLVAHTYSPSYSGARDQEDQGSKPARVNNSCETLSRKTLHKKGLVEWLKVQSLNSNRSTKKKKLLCQYKCQSVCACTHKCSCGLFYTKVINESISRLYPVPLFSHQCQSLLIAVLLV